MVSLRLLAPLCLCGQLHG